MSQTSPLDSTRQALDKALAASRTPAGLDPEVFRRLLGKQRARRLDAYMAHRSATIEQAMQEAQSASVSLMEALTPQPNRQALAEKAYLDRLQSGLSPLYFRTPVQGLPRTGKSAFVPCPGVSRSADAFGRVDDIGYLFVHKCSNHGGGAQDMAQAELERIALASTFPEGRYDGFVLRSPERVLLRCHQVFETRKTVLVLLQDGLGREEDMSRLHALCAQANLHPALHVVADTTENFLLMQPMIHARVVGEDALTQGQAQVLDQARARFARKFPGGHNGFMTLRAPGQ